MWRSSGAELQKLVRRPAAWLLVAVTVVLGLTFGYLIPYAALSDLADARADRSLASLLPQELVGNAIGGTPMFFGALALIMGVLVVGSEYGWGTWKTVLTQGPSRVSVYGGKLVALAVAAVVMVVAMFVFAGAAGVVIGLAEGQTITWPAFSTVLTGLAVGWLVVAMWMSLGALLAVALRGVALPIGLGLVWVLAVQNLLAVLAAPLVSWIASAQEVLPGPNAGSLVATLGASPQTPGVAELVEPEWAVGVLSTYLVGFVLVAAVVLRRRDVG